MSALSTLSKKIAAWEATVTEVELVVNGLAADDAETILSAFNRTKDVSLELDMSVADVVKLITKSNNKDPITGLYRYGPEARAKISGLETSIAILKNKCQSVIEKTLGLLQNNNITVKELFQPAANLSKATVAPVAGPIRSIDLEFRAENSKRYTEETLEESPDLLEKAKHVRERKAQEQRDGTASNASIENLLQLHASFLEKVRLHHAKLSAQKEASTLYLGDPLALFLKEPNQHQQQNRSRQCEALKTLRGILERIISRPDDINARRLRITHPVLKEKLTGHVGGIELLCAIGFQVRVQDGLAAATPENRVTALGQALSLREQVAALGARVFPTESHLCDDDDDNDLSGDSKNECSRARAVDMFPFLAPHTLWDVHLEMHEPAVEALTEVGETNGAAVKLSWLDWFDGLTNSKNAIDVALETL